MAAYDALERRVRTRLQSVDSDRLRRVLRAPSGIDLSSNDYLGLAQHPALKAAMAAAVEREGCGSTGSRLLRGERACFAAVERRFAAFKGTARALYFSSGYLANLAVLTTFPEAGDVILSDALNHASLIDGIRLSGVRRVVFPHLDVGALSRLMEAHRGAGRTFVVTESLFSMDGDEAPLRQYAELCRATGAHLIVDDAHAVGVYGQRGSGLVEEAGVDGDVFVSISTAGKALGVSGAFVTGPEWAIEFLIQKARPFVFSTAPPPAIAAALEASLDIVDGEVDRRARLASRAAHLRRRLAEHSIRTIPGRSQIVPVIIGDNLRAVELAELLQAAGFDVRAIRPPSVPPGTARLRLSVNVGLSEAVLDEFVSALASAVGQPTCSVASS